MDGDNLVALLKAALVAGTMYAAYMAGVRLGRWLRWIARRWW